MRCIYCHSWAGLIRSKCCICTRVTAIIERTAGRVGWTEMVDIFIAEGLSREQVDCVLDAEIGGAPTMRDRMTSDMANVLMQNLGMPGRQSPDDVRQVRLAMNSGIGAGTWNKGENPPECEIALGDEPHGRVAANKD